METKNEDNMPWLNLIKRAKMGCNALLFMPPHLSLTYLDLSGVYFRGLTDVGKLQNLKTLIISNTGIVSIPRCPPSLEYLDVSNNHMVDALYCLHEEDIAVLRNLKTLVIYGNIYLYFSKSIPLRILQF